MSWFNRDKSWKSYGVTPQDRQTAIEYIRKLDMRTKKRSAYGAGMADRQASARKRRDYGVLKKRYGWQSGAPATSSPMILMSSKELKGMDTDITTSVITTTNTNGGSFVCNLILPGNGSWNRIGRKVQLKSARLKGHMVYTYDTTTDALAGAARLVIVWDKQPSGNAIPAFDNIFGRTAQDGTETTEYLDSLRYDNTDRFAVLRDSIFTANPGQQSSNGEYIVHFDEYIKLGGRETVYSGQSDPQTIADISSGALYVYYRATDTNASAAGSWKVDKATCRLRYTDN